MVLPEHMQEVSSDLVTAIDEAQQGTFQPQRENDELTRVWSHGKLLGPETALTRLTERAKQNNKRNSVPYKKR